MTTSKDTTQGTPKGVQGIEIFVAPECDPSVLSEAPAFSTNAYGHDLLDEERIIERVHLNKAPIGLVLTHWGKSQAVFMVPWPEEPRMTPEEARLDDLNVLAEDITHVLLHAVDFELPPAAAALWDAGAELIEKQGTVLARMAAVFKLQAVLAVPGAAEDALTALRDKLVHEDPALALLAPSSAQDAPHAPAPLGVVRNIENLDFELDEDGTLGIGGFRQDEHIKLRPVETFALAMFMRDPVVQRLIDAADVQYQNQQEAKYRKDKQEMG